MKKLTERQEQVLDFFVGHSVRNYRPPSYVEIGYETGLKKNAVYAHMKALRKKGYLVSTSNSQAMQMTDFTMRRYGVLTFEQIRDIRQQLKGYVVAAKKGDGR